ncbi:MAG TPA: Glu-tRNA(Gln) amidotransferase subunit GatE [Thermoplasmata archaeon]|nr:Glu-tRNA(Gln) amidotransferase subunit GatE [Thermoplasmata archaeon]
MKAGLEVHQQLATGKLFCACPSELTDEVDRSFVRRLRAASGENLAVDPAAAFQASRGLVYRYESGPSDCLVDLDEEPPHPINHDALDVALTLALLLDARPVDEIEVMRKIVVDGSNTAGFQRTALVAVDGHLEVDGRRYSVLSICLEEDAARRSGGSETEVVYRLDRLGIPLVEIATGPEITTGPEARAVAEELGALLRATHRVKRGLGTIREDLNVSIEGGHRIELKGVQELNRIQQYVEGEAERQRILLAVRDELARRGAPPVADDPVDLTARFADLDSGPLGARGRGPGRVLALRLRGFADLLRSPPGSEERLGRELAEQVRVLGLRGLVHSDELPAYGIDGARVAGVRADLGLGPGDGFVLLTDVDATRARRAIARVARRADAARLGIPGETRDPLPDGRSRYSRPLPGRDRMYPETDIPPLVVEAERLARLARSLPERPATQRARVAATYRLAPELVRQLQSSDRLELFEALAHRGRSPTLVARLLTQDLPGLVLPEGVVQFDPSEDALDALLAAAEAGRFAKEGIPTVLAALAAGAPTLEAALARSGLAGLSADELAALVARVVERNLPLVRARGAAAFAPLMGDVMKEVRGRRDGQEVARVLRAAIASQAGGG